MGFLTTLLIFFVALTAHEFAHGWMAYQRGDSTAKLMGRLSLNPLHHIDPIGTVALPILLVITRAPIVFGWAKPVPINFSNLRNPKQDIIFVGLAGPMANILLAVVLGFIARIFVSSMEIFTVLLLGIQINLFLAFFNLIPIPPLDGSRVMMGLLPNELVQQYVKIEPFGFIIVLALFYMGFLQIFIIPAVKFFTRIALGI